MKKEQKNSSIIKAIDLAFASVPYPSDDDLVVGMRFEGSEHQSIYDLLKNVSKDDVTLDFLKTRYRGDKTAIIHFLSDKAYIYYLPAFLKITLTADWDSNVLDESPYFAFHQVAKGKPWGKENSLRSTSALTLDMLLAIDDAIDAMEKEYGSSLALEGAKQGIEILMSKVQDKQEK